MKKILTTVLLLAALTALILTGCGNNNTPDSSIAEINKFGVEVVPSALPSTGETKPQGSGTLAVPTTKEPGTVDEHNTQGDTTLASPSPTRITTPSYAPQPSYVPTTQPSPSPSDSTLPSPPASASNTTAEEAQKYIGKTREELFNALGYPVRSDYEPIDEDDPGKGSIGTLYFANGFTVTTEVVDGVETVTAVTE